jgi:hypothetical protein
VCSRALGRDERGDCIRASPSPHCIIPLHSLSRITETALTPLASGGLVVQSGGRTTSSSAGSPNDETTSLSAVALPPKPLRDGALPLPLSSAHTAAQPACEANGLSGLKERWTYSLGMRHPAARFGGIRLWYTTGESWEWEATMVDAIVGPFMWDKET